MEDDLKVETIFDSLESQPTLPLLLPTFMLMDQCNRPTDEQISAYEQSIKAEESGKDALIGPLDCLSTLMQQYEGGSTSYLAKFHHLMKNYTHYRKSRGDDERSSFFVSFYRALSFRFFQNVRHDPRYLTLAREQAVNHREMLLNAGFEEIAFIDFYEEYFKILQYLDSTTALLNLIDVDFMQFESARDSLPEAERRDYDLYLVMNDTMISNAVVVHVRFIISAYLKLNAIMYEPFMENGLTVEMFCNQFTEAMDREADQIHIIAATTVFNSAIRVAYIDAGVGNEVTFHDFSPNETANILVGPKVCLLYRPGHYDILYE